MKIIKVLIALLLTIGFVTSSYTTKEVYAEEFCVKTEYWNSCGEFLGWSGTHYDCSHVITIIIDVECEN